MCFSKMPSAGSQVAPSQVDPTAAAYVSPEADPNSPAGAATTRRKLLINPNSNPNPKTPTGLQIPGGVYQGPPVIGVRG